MGHTKEGPYIRGVPRLQLLGLHESHLHSHHHTFGKGSRVPIRHNGISLGNGGVHILPRHDRTAEAVFVLCLRVSLMSSLYLVG